MNWGLTFPEAALLAEPVSRSPSGEFLAANTSLETVKTVTAKRSRKGEIIGIYFDFLDWLPPAYVAEIGLGS